jgi:hypothetical protein
MTLLKSLVPKKGVVIPTVEQLRFRAHHLRLRENGANWRRRRNLGAGTAENTPLR